MAITKIEIQNTYYTENEINLICEYKGDSIKIPVRNIKGTIANLKSQRQKLDEEITINEKWLTDVQPELNKLDYFIK